MGTATLAPIATVYHRQDFQIKSMQKGQTNKFLLNSAYLYTLQVHNIKFGPLLYYSAHVLYCYLDLKDEEVIGI